MRLSPWTRNALVIGALASLLAACAAGTGTSNGSGSSAQGAPAAPDDQAAAPEPGGASCTATTAAWMQRIGGSDRVGTAVALADAGWGEAGAPTVVLASATDFPDALSATPWAAANGAPLLLTAPDQLDARVGGALDRLGTTEVVIVGGPSAVSERVEREVASQVSSVRRLAGSDRFETAAAIARDLHTSAGEVVVVTAHAFADAVAAGPLVSRGGHAPVLLTSADDLPTATAEVTSELGATRATVVGGEAVIADAVLDELRELGAEPQRIAGPDRFATSAEVVREASRRHGGADGAAVVTGLAFPDALAANAFAARTGTSVLLADQDDLIDHPPTTQLMREVGRDWRCTTVVGGSAAIEPRVAEQLGSHTGAEPPDGHPVLLSAGDIASCGLRGDDRTADLLDGLRGTIVTLGDNAYDEGTAQQYRDCWRPTWGRHHVRTRASLGNHDIRTADGGPTYDHFGVRAGPRGQGWYGFDVGPHWRVLVLNTNCPGTVRCEPGSPQHEWLRAELEAAGERHVIIAGHHPRWSSGVYAPGETRVADLWRLAAAHGVDVWLAGHEHGYERFAPKDATGASVSHGIQQFTAGTGGASLREFGAAQPGSEARIAVHGVLELTLRPDGYAWRLVDVDGVTRDAGERTIGG